MRPQEAAMPTEPESQSLLVWLLAGLGAAGSLGGWFVRQLWTRNVKMSDDTAEALKREQAVSDQLRAKLAKVDGRLQEIERANSARLTAYIDWRTGTDADPTTEEEASEALAMEIASARVDATPEDPPTRG
jgi:Tfp pilus assembly protein PilN